MANNVRSLNKVILVGRVGRDPEITHIPSSNSDVAKFSLATTEGYKDRNQEWKERTEWHNIVAWGGIVQRIERSIAKGDLVLVEGKIRTYKYKVGEEDRRGFEIRADNVYLLEKNRSSQRNEGSNYNSNASNISNDFSSQQPPERDINDDISFDNETNDPF